MNKEPKFLALYLYVSPDDTLAEGESPTVQTSAKVDTLPEVLKFVRERFDGLETFDEHFAPEAKAFFKKNKKASAVYRGDDYSAGQWFSLTRVNDDGVSVEVGEGDE